MIYIDTSVLVAYYCPEALSHAAQREIARVADPTVSRLTEVEFCSALGTKVRTGELDAAAAHRLLACFRMHCSGGDYRIVPVEARDYTAASGWLAAMATPLRTLDALHLAVAFSNRLTVVTADKDLAASARHFGVKHKLIS
jgi:predicted nucleic acid-binding protein